MEENILQLTDISFHYNYLSRKHQTPLHKLTQCLQTVNVRLNRLIGHKSYYDI